VPDRDDSRNGGELLPLRAPTDDDCEVGLRPPELEPLSAEQEAEAVELMAALFVAAARRCGSASGLGRAA
jgi:hypothetical protein